MKILCENNPDLLL